MGLTEVTVRNEYENTIWVQIDENQKHPIETREETIKETDFETFHKLVLEGKVAVPIKQLPVDVSGKTDIEFKEHLKQYWKENQEGKYTWTGFVGAGEEPVAPGKINRWALKGDESRYFLSIRTTKDGRPVTVASCFSRRDPLITVDAAGQVNDEVAPAPSPTAISGKTYFQKLGGSTFIGDPKTGVSNWDAGTLGNVGGSHNLKPVTGALQSGAAVRIISNSTNLQSADYKYMYAAESGNVFYDTLRESGRDSDKQLWIVSKTVYKGNSEGDTLTFGDQVRISNRFWKNANLGINGNWLQCVADDPTIWILKEAPRLE